MPWADADARSPDDGMDGSRLHYPLSDLRIEHDPTAITPNVVVLLLESWRADSMNAAVSPNIHALGQRSTIALDHISTGNQTTCGVFGLFYGLHSTYWTPVKANSDRIDNPVLIDVLKSRDYDFGIFADSNFERHKIKDTIFRGIAVQEDFSEGSKVEQDAELNRRLLEFIDAKSEAGQPFFALAFYKSTHAPYEYPPEHVVFGEGSRLVPMGFTSGSTDPSPYLRNYRNAVHYLDALVGEVVDRLEFLEQMHNTVIVVTTDHGESFNDNGDNYWGHGSSFTLHQIPVPLIFYAPGHEPRVLHHRTSHVDIAPTLLAGFLGCVNDPADYSNGQNLFDRAAGTTVRPLAVGSYVTHAYVFGDEVYEIRPMRTKRYRLHDIRVQADPPPPEALKSLAKEISRFMCR